VRVYGIVTELETLPYLKGGSLDYISRSPQFIRGIEVHSVIQ
jgi:hypothetical protein